MAFQIPPEGDETQRLHEVMLTAPRKLNLLSAPDAQQQALCDALTAAYREGWRDSAAYNS